MQTELVTKGEFAAMINVSPGRVSQYLAEGKISAEAIHGSGQRAKIDPVRAKADLRLTLDVSQRLGNGIETRLDSDPAAPPPQYSLPPQQVGIDYEIKQQKLEQARRANRNAAIEDAKARGQLMETGEARANMNRVAAAMLEIFEGGLTDIAMAVAAEFKLPQRDVKHFVHREFRKVREIAAQQMRQRAISLPEIAQASIEAEDIEAAPLS
jgi:hypothetical protein